jgi:hypothetical protein
MARRLQVDLSEEDYDKLRGLAKVEGRSLAEVVRRALSTEAYVAAQESDGGKLILEDKNGDKTQLVRV